MCPIFCSSAADDFLRLIARERKSGSSGRSNRHVTSIADSAVEGLNKAGFKGLRVEGKKNGDWVLIDAGDVIVHLFRPEVRSFYNIEKMWGIEPPPAPEPTSFHVT